MIDPWAWTLSTTLVVIGWVVTSAITVAGWIITAVRDCKAAKTAKQNAEKNAREAERRFEERMGLMKSQLQASNETINVLRAQVAQLEESNRLYAAANPEDRAPWSDATCMGRNTFVVRNESNRNVIVTGVHASDPKMKALLSFARKLPLVCEPGDSLEYIAVGIWQYGTPDTVIDWHWEGSNDERHTRRANIKP